MASLVSRTVAPGIAAGMLIVCGVLVPQAASAAGRCAPASNANTDILGVMENLLTALRTENQDLFQQVTAPDFYAYDGGVRLAGPALLELVKRAHAGGKRWAWTVTDPEIHVECNLAWITYVNKGSVEDASGRQDLTWLESAVLNYSDARWHIRFVHSTRAAKQP